MGTFEKIRAKFVVQNVTIIKWSSGSECTVKLIPVTSGSEENKSFFASTPSGSIEIKVNEYIAAAFEPGKSYYIDFTKADN